MPGKFMTASEIVREDPEWGVMGWVSRPANGGKNLTVIDVTLKPGLGHVFHKHPDQEEVIFVIEGKVEQWLDQEKKMLAPGEAAFIPPGLVHASFAAGDAPARAIAILGPCVGEGGYEMVAMDDQEPWKSLR